MNKTKSLDQACDAFENLSKEKPFFGKLIKANGEFKKHYNTLDYAVNYINFSLYDLVKLQDKKIIDKSIVPTTLSNAKMHIEHYHSGSNNDLIPEYYQSFAKICSSAKNLMQYNS